MEVVSLDYEQQVVTKMEENKPKGLNLKYVKGNVTDLAEYADQQFDFSVDKGTLDAIAVDDREETVSQCNAYFNETVRTLKQHGVFMVVSLLQPHVLKILTDFFVRENEVSKWQKKNLFTFKIYRIDKVEGYAEKQFIKYMVIVKKNPIDDANEQQAEMRRKF